MINIAIKIGLVALIYVLMGCSRVPDSNDINKPIAGVQRFILTTDEIKKLTIEAENGKLDAAYKLFEYYDFGDMDYEKSIYWLMKAAENGHISAQSILGRAYVQHPRFKKDLDKARYWLEKAAAQGNLAAQNELNELIKKSKGKVQ